MKSSLLWARMPQEKFGAEHTERKLQVLHRYLESYTTALKNQKFRTVYFDGFAGTGSIPQDGLPANLLQADDLEVFIHGSARRALSVKHPFDEYVFVEKSAKKLSELQLLAADYPHLADRIRFLRGDANSEVGRFCRATNWQKTRAVVFLDPFGNQVKWDTVEIIAGTKAIDLWYLFPAGLGVHRQIGKDGSVHVTHGESLNALLGTDDWKGKFLRQEATTDLFGATERSEKIATPVSVTEFMIDRMKLPFEGRVSEKWLPLGSRGIHMYSLLFAAANPSEAAWKLANKLATAVMK